MSAAIAVVARGDPVSELLALARIQNFVHLDQGFSEYVGGVAHLAADFGLGSRHSAVVERCGAQNVTDLLPQVSPVVVQLAKLIARRMNQVAKGTFLGRTRVEPAQQPA